MDDDFFCEVYNGVVACITWDDVGHMTAGLESHNRIIVQLHTNSYQQVAEMFASCYHILGMDEGEAYETFDDFVKQAEYYRNGSSD
jgi:hypothetical protein